MKCKTCGDKFDPYDVLNNEYCSGPCYREGTQPKGNTMSDREIRELKWRLKQANKSIGRQGETIHQLRGELAEVRSLNSRLDRGALRYMDSAQRVMAAQLELQEGEIQMLKEKLAAGEETTDA